MRDELPDELFERERILGIAGDDDLDDRSAHRSLFGSGAARPLAGCEQAGRCQQASKEGPHSLTAATIRLFQGLQPLVSPLLVHRTGEASEEFEPRLLL